MTRYDLIITSTARRQLAEQLPGEIPGRVAFAAMDFIAGPLLEDPHRVGKPLLAPLAGRWSARRGTYRIVYAIDDAGGTVTVTAVVSRAEAYRSP